MSFEKVFQGNGETFSAKYEAEKWLTENGYSFGSSSIDGPMGVVARPDVYISKWRNMTRAEQKELDGTLHTSREGPAKLVLRQEPPHHRSSEYG